MSDSSKKMIYGSMAASALVGVAAIVDIVTGIPFGWGSGNTMIMDILFIVSAGIVMYLGWESLKDFR
jgi:zinc transporter ZupT